MRRIFSDIVNAARTLARFVRLAGAVAFTTAAAVFVFAVAFLLLWLLYTLFAVLLGFPADVSPGVVAFFAAASLAAAAYVLIPGGISYRVLRGFGLSPIQKGK